jgi:hypothetical protein
MLKFFFEGVPFETELEVIKGAELKTLVQCRKEFSLFLDTPKEPKDKKIMDASIVRLIEGMYFYSVPPGVSFS